MYEVYMSKIYDGYMKKIYKYDVHVNKMYDVGYDTNDQQQKMNTKNYRILDTASGYLKNYKLAFVRKQWGHGSATTLTSRVRAGRCFSLLMFVHAFTLF